MSPTDLPGWAEHLADPTDARLADYHLLDDQRARRRAEGDELFVAEGYVAIDRAIDSGHRLRSVLLIPSRVERFAARVDAIVARGDAPPPVFVVDREHVAGVVGFDLHRGVLAAADRRPLPSVGDVVASGAQRLAVLEGLNDPENVGVIARAGRALGIDALVLDPTCTDPYARRTVRVSMGEILHLPVARASAWPGGLAELADGGVETWALTPDPTADDLWRLDVPDRLGLVLGAEGPGLSEAAMSACIRRVRIPIADGVDSLNVGHAAAVAFAATSPWRA